MTCCTKTLVAVRVVYFIPQYIIREEEYDGLIHYDTNTHLANFHSSTYLIHTPAPFFADAVHLQ